MKIDLFVLRNDILFSVENLTISMRNSLSIYPLVRKSTGYLPHFHWRKIEEAEKRHNHRCGRRRPIVEALARIMDVHNDGKENRGGGGGSGRTRSTTTMRERERKRRTTSGGDKEPAERMEELSGECGRREGREAAVMLWIMTWCERERRIESVA